MAPRRSGSVIRNRDGSWSIRYRTGSGKRKQVGTFPTQRDAVRRLNEALASIGSGYHLDDITFSDFADRWLAVYEASPATVNRVTSQLSRMKDDFGDTLVSRITPEDVGAWRKTISKGQAQQVHGLLRQVLKSAVEWGYITVNPASLVRNPKPRKAEVPFFDKWDEIYRISDEMPKMQALPIFAAGTGLRPEEWCALTWSDLKDDHVVVRRAWREVGGLTEYSKTDASRRIVPIRKVVRDALDAHPRRSDLVFPSKRGTYIRIRNWRRREWEDALDAAGVQYRRPYAMRHSYAAWSLAAGIDTFTVARRMGTSVQMIDETYGHLVRGSIDRERELLDEFDVDR